MRKAWLWLAAAVLTVTTCGGQDAPGEDPAAPREVAQTSLTAGTQVLLVVGNTTLSAADTALRTRLTNLGATVTVKSAASSQSSDANGKRVVVISDSVAAADAGAKFRDVIAGVAVMKNSILDDMKMTGTTSGTDFGTAGSQTQLALLAVSHPVAAGLTVAVTSSAQTFTWGKPGMAATRIATIAGNANQTAIFLYERNAPMVGQTAPGRRAGFFTASSAASALTSNGGKLLDNLIEWLAIASGCTTNADCPSIPNATGVCNNNVCTLVCNGGFKMCGGTCVPSMQTCPQCMTNADCPMIPNGAGVCTMGTCNVQCNAGFKSCSGACVPTMQTCPQCMTNADCPMIPNGAGVCTMGTCNVQCNAGFKSCSGACVPTMQTCPQCMTNADCPMIPNGAGVCTMGTCNVQCNAGFKSCSGACVPTMQTCPQCMTNADCPMIPNGAGVCTMGTCNVQCNAGFKSCSGACVPTMQTCPQCMTNADCPMIPNGAGVCAMGTCSVQCNAGFVSCGGSCVSSMIGCNSKLMIAPSNVTASTHDGNVPGNTVDGSLSTRWSAQGNPQWIRFDLGSSRRVGFVKIAFYSGSSRTNFFDVQVSSDGVNFTDVLTGGSSALNDNLQTFDFDDATARYVRIVGHGNSTNTWNSYTEVEVFGG